MRLLGLTGDIACGKSTVAEMLSEKGGVILDSDQLVRELYADPNFASRVASLFTSNVLDPAGGVDRAALGRLVFGDAVGLQRLEQIVHPAVAELRAHKLERLDRDGKHVVAIAEAVKLLESGQGRECDEIWCVVCSPEVQKERLMKNRGLTEDEALSRMAAQPSRDAKVELAGPVPLRWITNDGSKAELAEQVDRLWSGFAGAQPAVNGTAINL